MFGKAIRVTLVGALVAGAIAMTQSVTLAAPRVIKAKNDCGSESNCWSPGDGHVSANVGQKVIWKNPTNRIHDVKSMNTGKDWNLKRTRLKRDGGRYSRRFKKPGLYYYRCTIHSTKTENGWDGMWGIVHVSK